MNSMSAVLLACTLGAAPIFLAACVQLFMMVVGGKRLLCAEEDPLKIHG